MIVAVEGKEKSHLSANVPFSKHRHNIGLTVSKGMFDRYSRLLASTKVLPLPLPREIEDEFKMSEDTRHH